MAHFAQLDTDNNVVKVIVISNADMIDESGQEHEHLGTAICRKLHGQDTVWKQTSYNGTFRKTYAQVGYKYSETSDLFYDPNKPFPSWHLSDTYDWVAPTPYPNDGNLYGWDEDMLTWVLNPEEAMPQ